MNYEYLALLAIPLAVYTWRMYVSIPSKICKSLFKNNNYAYSGGDNSCIATLYDKDTHKIFCKISYDKKVGFDSLTVEYGSNNKLKTFKSAPSCMFKIYGYLEEFHNRRTYEFKQLRAENGSGNIFVGP